MFIAAEYTDGLIDDDDDDDDNAGVKGRAVGLPSGIVGRGVHRKHYKSLSSFKNLEDVSDRVRVPGIIFSTFCIYVTSFRSAVSNSAP